MAPRSVVPTPTVSPFLLAEPGAVSRRIEALGVPRPVRAGEHLYRQGEASSSFHVLVSGRVRVHMLRPDGTVRVISWAEPGASLGEGACFDGSVNQVSATAITPCEVLAVGRDALVAAARDDTELLVEVVRRVSHKQRVLHLHVFLDGLPARERVVLLLGHLVEAYGDGALGTSARLSVRPPVAEDTVPSHRARAPCGRDARGAARGARARRPLHPDRARARAPGPALRAPRERAGGRRLRGR
jgi:CRP/FNR family cyclic AMP-dependent transcriptional regulator